MSAVVTFSADVLNRAALAGARARLRHWLLAQGCDADLTADLTLVVSELAANALESGEPSQATVDVDLEREGVQVLVSNPAPTAFRWTAGGMPDPTGAQGRGLYIVDQLMDAVRVDHHDAVTSVSARRARGG